jgi:ribose transport system permease protein
MTSVTNSNGSESAGSAAPQPGSPGPLRWLWDRLRGIDVRQIGLPLAVGILFVLFTVTSDVFWTARNFQNVALQASALALVAFGQAFVILARGLDLSVGSTVAFVSVVAGLVMASAGAPLGFLAGVGAGLAIGLANSLVVTKLGVVPFVATLAMLSIASGAALTLSGGTPVVGLPDSFTRLASQRVIGIPLPAIFVLACFLAAYLFLRATRFGRYIFAIGGNPEAARLSGISVGAMTALTYVICSVLAAFGGLILTARVASGQPTLGGSMALESVAAVVLGGVSLFGGRGSLFGVLWGVVFVSILGNGLNLLNVKSYTQMMVLGVALIGAVALDRRLARRTGD